MTKYLSETFTDQEFTALKFAKELYAKATEGKVSNWHDFILSIAEDAANEFEKANDFIMILKGKEVKTK